MSILGTRVQRVEDPKFLTTGGVYTADLDDERLAGAGHVTYVRSTMAHATIVSIDTSDAVGMDGVIGVYTAEDLGLEPVPPFALANPAMTKTLLATGKVRYVGEPVVAVVTERADQGEDAAEAVFVELDPLPAVASITDALGASGDALLWPDTGSNVCSASTAVGMPANTDPAEFFAGCEVMVEHTITNQRVAACPLEVRSAAAAWIDGRLIQWDSTQHAQGARDALAAANGVEADAVRVIAPDVGGGFGAKIGVYPEEMLLGGIAKACGRPVRWTETRSENMLSQGQGRAQLQTIRLGGTPDGRVTHYQLDVTQDAGAHPEIGVALPTFMTRTMAPGVYDIENVECETRCVVTNTASIVAYRGAGRPEATAAIERGMDLFALECGLDPAEVRRRNFFAPFTEPVENRMTGVYDVGDYIGSLENALTAAGYDELRAEQARRRESGDQKLLGIGVCTYVEITGGVGDFSETGRIVVHGDGTATVYTGTSPHGQGHATAWAMIAQDSTGIPMEQVTVIHGDTDVVPSGLGTMGSRSLQQGGMAVKQAADALVEKAKPIAASLLEANEADIVLDNTTGTFHVAGTPAVSKGWPEVHAAAVEQGENLDVEEVFKAAMPTFPFGTHVAVVEVDRDTGQARLVRHVACDDAGVIMNPMLVDGQVHGGIAQGAAQALYEEVVYDADGNNLTSNFMDYAMVSAAELPSYERIPMETPTPVNALGAKGIGESGTIGSTPSIQSAVIDALSHLGVRHIEIPCTPMRVWEAMNSAG